MAFVNCMEIGIVSYRACGVGNSLFIIGHCGFVYVCVCVCVCVCMYVCVCVCIYMHIYIYLYTRVGPKFPASHTKAASIGKCCEGYIAPSMVRLMYQ